MKVHVYCHLVLWVQCMTKTMNEGVYSKCECGSITHIPLSPPTLSSYSHSHVSLPVALFSTLLFPSLDWRPSCLRLKLDYFTDPSCPSIYPNTQRMELFPCHLPHRFHVCPLLSVCMKGRSKRLLSTSLFDMMFFLLNGSLLFYVASSSRFLIENIRMKWPLANLPS